jgi:hypothetical protein
MGWDTNGEISGTLNSSPAHLIMKQEEIPGLHSNCKARAKQEQGNSKPNADRSDHRYGDRWLARLAFPRRIRMP